MVGVQYDIMNKKLQNKIGVLVDFDNQLELDTWKEREDGMARGLEVHVERCQHCEFDEEPTFVEQRRLSYRQVGEEGDYAYSRSISLVQEVLVCLNCGEVHKVVNEVH